MIFKLKPWPISEPHPAFPTETFIWRPVIPVQIIYKHSPPSRRIEAIVDSGSPHCLFHASFCKSLGIKKLESGIESVLSGVISGTDVPTAQLYFHKVKIRIREHLFETKAGFSWGLSWGGLLGMRGFFENFKVRFDFSEYPPQMDVERIYRV